MTETDSRASDRPIESRPSRSPIGIIELICVVVMIASGLAAWVIGIHCKGYDYDEVVRAHSIRLTSRGLRPYTDFFEVHPPYFILLSPLWRMTADPVSVLWGLRVLTGVGNLVFLAGMIALGNNGLPEWTSRRWGWLAIAFVAFHPMIVDDLVEFRIDGWGYAAIVWATFRYVRGNRQSSRMFEFAVTTAFCAALFSPKTVFLPPLIALFDMTLGFTSRREFVRAGMTYLAGVIVAAVLFFMYLFVNGIGLDRTIMLLGRYHASSNAHAGFGFGLLHQILTIRLLLILTCAGFVAWVIGSLRRRTLTGPFEPAVLVWLLMQAALVTYPYKQYYAPWFLFAGAFVPSLGPLLDAIFGRLRVIVFIAACVLSTLGSFQVAQFWQRHGTAASENTIVRWMNKVSSPEDRVVGSPPYHPIDRLDTFFLSFNTTDPGGFDSERIFGELPGLKSFVTVDHYRNELDSHPPAVVVLKSPFFEVKYPATQGRVLDDYLLRNGYRTVRVQGVWFSLRPDRFEHASRNGYLE